METFINLEMKTFGNKIKVFYTNFPHDFFYQISSVALAGITSLLSDPLLLLAHKASTVPVFGSLFILSLELEEDGVEVDPLSEAASMSDESSKF